MKRILALVLSVIIVAALGVTAFAEENVLKVGMEGTYAPYTYHDDSGALTGFVAALLFRAMRHARAK